MLRVAASQSHRMVHQFSTTTTAFSKNGRAILSRIPRWPMPMIESSGDYRAEAYLEELVGGSLYEKQSQLPRLPVPEICETLGLLRDTVIPLAESESEKQEFLSALQEFEESDHAQTLQQRLVNRCNNEIGDDSSWLSIWWNQLGYLQVRDPVVINVSYFFHLRDDWTLPSVPNRELSPRSLTRGVMRAASILHAVADFRNKVCSGTLKHEQIGRKEPQTPLCSVAYKYMFHACRIPHLNQDGYRIYDPSIYSHCIVARKGYFFKVDFIDSTTHKPYPLTFLEDSLSACIQIADQLEESQIPKIGWLTSGNRDNWTKAREDLLSLGGPPMEEALNILESGAVLICLDDENPESRRQCGNIFWHGGHNSGGNRWFDKSIQIVCCENGKAGIIGEHSMMDGMPMLNFADKVTKATYESVNKCSYRLTSVKKVHPIDIFGNVFKKTLSSKDLNFVETLSVEAERKLKALIDAHDLSPLNFQAYGSSYIKRLGYSPDAYLQIAIQLATYRLFGKQVATYEASQVRPFKHGRTETTRTVSLCSNAFLSKMGTYPRFDDVDKRIREEQLKLFGDAVKSHAKYLRRASIGKGVDRHLFGLSMLVDQNENSPILFTNKLYQRAKHWRVSTSNLSHPRFNNWGYGEVVPDGIGLSYGIKSNSLMFNITAQRSHNWTEKLTHLLEESLLELKYIHDGSASERSKL